MTEKRPQEAHPTTEQAGDVAERHAENSLSMRVVWLSLGALVVLLAGTPPLVSVLLNAYADPEQLPSETRMQEFDPGPGGHWNDPAADLARLRKEEDQRLNEYTWLDREAGRVRIPIDRAMELLVRRYGPAAEDASGPEAESEAHPSRTEGGTP